MCTYMFAYEYMFIHTQIEIHNNDYGWQNFNGLLFLNVNMLFHNQKNYSYFKNFEINNTG